MLAPFLRSSTRSGYPGGRGGNPVRGRVSVFPAQTHSFGNPTASNGLGTGVDEPLTRPAAPTRRDATLLVALAASMWGLDGLLRKPLATALDPGTVVLWEHVIALAVLLPWVPRAVRAFLRCRPRDQLAVIAIGVGASAVATALFTKSFAIAAKSNDFVTPLVLQKLQPLF